ncbi:MAG: tetratricopeptide repeat protein [Candidatus Omnitrophica bacterium]|nr:tetratricopeptide repeat protein [Candidatus Omnitrophota bacterium]
MIRKNNIFSILIFLGIVLVTTIIFAESSPSSKDNADAQEQYYIAVKHFRDKEYKIALEELTKIINDYPKTEIAAKAQYTIGEIYLIQDKQDEALLAYKKAAELDPSNESAWRSIAEIYEKRRKYDDAVEAYKKVISLIIENKEPDEELIPLYEKIAGILLDRKKYEEALGCYNKILALDKNQRYTSRRSIKGKIASIYENLNKPEEAEKIYREIVNETGDTDYMLRLANILVNRKADAEVFDLCAISMNKHGHTFLYHRGTGIQVEVGKYYIAHNRTDDWLAFLQKKSEESENNVYAYILIAGAYEAKKDMDNAAHYYELALQNISASDKYSSLRVGVLKMAANSYLDASNYAKAAELFLELSKSNVQNYFNSYSISEDLAVCYLKNGEVDKANSIFDELNKKYPDRDVKDRYRSDYLKIYISQGNYDGAIDVTVEPMRKSERYSYSHSPKSIIELSKANGKSELLISALQKRIEAEPSNAFLYVILAAAYMSQEKYTSAAECYEKLLELMPNELEIYKSIYFSKVYAWTSNPEKQIWCYKKMIELDPENTDNIRYYLDIVRQYSAKHKEEEALATLTELLSRYEIQDGDNAREIAETYKCVFHMWKEAIPFYKKAIDLGVYDPIRRKLEMGECYYYIKDFVNAKEVLQEVVATTDDEYYKNEALAKLWNIDHPDKKPIVAFPPPKQSFHFKSTDVDRIKKTYEKMVLEYKSLSDDEKIYKKQEVIATGLYLSKKMIEQSRASEASEVLTELSKVAPDRPDIYCTIGDVYFYGTPKGTDKAIEWYKRALDHKNDDVDILLHLGYAYERKGDYKNAAKCYSDLVNDKNRDKKFFWYKHGETRLKTLELINQKQLIKDWLVIGPFANDDGKGFETAYPPEKGIDIKVSYKGKNDMTISWTRPYKGEYGYVDLDKIFAPNNDKTVAYALIDIVSPAKKQVQFKVGSWDTMTIWLNGNVICNQRSGFWVILDQFVVNAELNEGSNQVLVKICEDTKDWGFYFRVTDMNGNPVSDLKYAVPSK